METVLSRMVSLWSQTLVPLRSCLSRLLRAREDASFQSCRRREHDGRQNHQARQRRNDQTFFQRRTHFVQQEILHSEQLVRNQRRGQCGVKARVFRKHRQLRQFKILRRQLRQRKQQVLLLFIRQPVPQSGLGPDPEPEFFLLILTQSEPDQKRFLQHTFKRIQHPQLWRRWRIQRRWLQRRWI